MSIFNNDYADTEFDNVTIAIMLTTYKKSGMFPFILTSNVDVGIKLLKMWDALFKKAFGL